MRILSCTVLACVLCIGTADAAVTRQEIADFLEEAPTSGTSDPERKHLIALLQAALPRAGIGKAAQQLARRWTISSAAAEMALEAVLVDELPYARTATEESARKDRIARAYLDALKLAPDSRRLWAAALEHLSLSELCETPGLADLYFASPVSGFFLDPDAGCSVFVLSYARHHSMTPLSWWKLYEFVRDGSKRQALEIATARLYADSVRALPQTRSAHALPFALREYYISLGDAALSPRLVAEVLALPEELRQELILSRPSEGVVNEGRQVADRDHALSRFEEFRAFWILALLDLGRPDEARAWVSRMNLPRAVAPAKLRDDDYPRNRVFDGDGVDQAEFLRRLATPSSEDPFAVFVGNGEQGLLWGPAEESVLSSRGAARFMLAERYPDIAAYLFQRACRHRHYRSKYERPWMERLDEFPVEVRDAARLAAAELAALHATDATCPKAGQRPGAPAQRRSFKELPIPAELRRVEGAKGMPDGRKTVTGGLLPRHANVIRAEQSGDLIAAVSLSQDVDPVGEVSGGGYWLHISSDGGREWHRALYLGMQQYQPYVVPENSRLALIDARTLRLEVEVQELDPESITFPPVALGLKRKARDLYLELSLDDLERDTDADLLTDWLEEKLRTDASNRDTDGDGIGDGYDDMPQVSARAEPHALAPIVISAMNHITGYDAAALITAPLDARSQSDDLLASLAGRTGLARPTDYMFILADPALFAGITIPGNAIILTHADVAYLESRFGICYPLEFHALWLNRSGTHAVVEWSASWVGGTLHYQKKDGKWMQEVVSRWIT